MKKFKAESQKVLDMMINSIYTNKEIFLRELLSNCSDALDKLYFKSLNGGLNGMTREDFKVQRLGARIGELNTQIVDLEFMVQYLNEENAKLKTENAKLTEDNKVLSEKVFDAEAACAIPKEEVEA